VFARKPGGDQRSSEIDVYVEQIMVLLKEQGDIIPAASQSGLTNCDINIGFKQDGR